MQLEPENRKGSSPGALFRISEIYESLQGEGLLTGTPSIFVRTSGCNLRCWFCDTRFASWEPTGKHRTTAEIGQACEQFAARHVVLTGGEPMIYHQLPELCEQLRHPHSTATDATRHLTIETAGTVYQELECDLMSISPKLASSAPGEEHGSWAKRHHQRREQLDVVRALMNHYPYQLKFVVDRIEDAYEVGAYLDRLGKYDPDLVMLMPQGTDQRELEKQADWLLPWCRKHQFRFCPRSHIAWFGNRRGT